MSDNIAGTREFLAVDPSATVSEGPNPKYDVVENSSIIPGERDIPKEPQMRQRTEEERIAEHFLQQEGYLREENEIARAGLQRFIEERGILENSGSLGSAGNAGGVQRQRSIIEDRFGIRKNSISQYPVQPTAGAQRVLANQVSPRTGVDSTPVEPQIKRTWFDKLFRRKKST